jgi:Sulfotransferase family
LAWSDIVLGPTPLGKLNLVYYRKQGINKHSTARKVREFIGEDHWKDYYVFSVVRDPLDRLMSFYYFCEKAAKSTESWNFRSMYKLLPGVSGGSTAQWPGVQAYLATKSFSEFIRHPLFQQEPGAGRQADILGGAGGELIVDRVARYETLPDDFLEICRTIGFRDVNLGWRNASRNRDVARSNVSADDVAYIKAMYERDFRAFYPERLPGEVEGRASS